MQDYSPPKYFIVKKSLVEKIDNDVFPVGSMIPSERELMALFDVSRITVRKAVEELEQEGYLYKMQGKGTFVKGDQKSQDLISITSCTEDVKRLGMNPKRKLLHSGVMTADKKRQRKLNLADGEDVYCIARVLYADSEPLNYTRTYLPYKYIHGIEKHDFANESLYEVLEKQYGIRITHATRSIEAVIAHDEVSDLLDLREGVPLLLFECVTYGAVNGKEVPIEAFKCYYRSDKFKFCINQVR